MKNKLLFILLVMFFGLGCTASSVSDTLSQAGSSEPQSSVALTTTTGDSVILDCWQWPFSSIKSNLSAIAAAGYTAIQVSPVQLTKSSSSSMSWYLFYQPCNLKIGNAQLGTEADFVSLCSAANAYGIKIIVDAVLNQVADNGTDGGFDSNVDSTFTANASTWFHNHGTCADWTNRYDMTQQNLGNGPDWNTQNSTVQSMHLAFLNQCIADGAGGFRFDAAKSIETNIGVDANTSWAGTYWTTMMSGMTNCSSLFLYGEVLPDYNDNESAYQTYMRTTTTGYLSQVSSAIDNATLTTGNLLSISHNIGTVYTETATKAIVYIENWDNYNGSVGVNTSGFSYNKRLLANAIMGSRAGMVNIVFARPYETLWSDPVLIAVNNFKIFATGVTEYLRNPSNSVLIIERGTLGMVIVNAGSSQYISSSTNIPNGTYTDQGPSGATFTVSGGTLTGTMPATTAVVLKAGSVTIPSAPTGLTAAAASSSSISLSWTASSGATSYSVYQSTSSSGTYSLVGTATGVSYTATGLTASATYYYKVTATNSAGTSDYSSVANASTPAPASGLTVHFKVNSYANWSTVYCYYWSSTGSPVSNTWPGTLMTSEGNSWYVFTIPGSTSSNVIFNNNSSQTIDLSRATSEGWFVPTGTSSSKITGTWYSANPDNTAPSAPVISSVGSATTSSLTVTWAASSGATSYTVYRASSSTGTYASVGTATTTSFTDTGLASGTTYYYEVSATNSYGTSALSACASGATLSVVTIPGAPATVTAAAVSGSSTSLAVSWTASTGAASYTVYQSTSSTGTFTSAGTATGTSLTVTGLTASTTYYYKVTATNTAGTSDYSSVASATTNSASATVTTTIKVVYNVGYGNYIYLRGSLSPLSWTSGVVATWTTGNVWVYTTTAIASGASFEFKALKNDSTWSTGSNFTGTGGSTITVTPSF